MVIDGSVRDSASIAALGFPVFCRGLDIRGTSKLDPGRVGETITLGSVEIRRGDVVVADADAVVVLPPEAVADAVSAGEARVAREAAMMERLRSGETTLQILGLETGEQQ
jgi:4-hydroxy-4-methyl-2-oxoglutarate aldolase